MLGKMKQVEPTSKENLKRRQKKKKVDNSVRF